MHGLDCEVVVVVPMLNEYLMEDTKYQVQQCQLDEQWQPQDTACAPMPGLLSCELAAPPVGTAAAAIKRAM